jgi:hypothetical protein
LWNVWPRHVKKLAARKAYDKALKIASADTILAGATLYAQTCSREEQFQAHLSSWLNGQRWEDEVKSIRPQPAVTVDWYQQCQEVHGGACGLNRYWHHTRMEMEKAKADA